MYPDLVRRLVVVTGLLGVVLLWIGADRGVTSLVACGAALALWSFVTSEWIVVKIRRAVRRSRRAGYRSLVLMPASRLTCWLALRASGLAGVEGPATEYHVHPQAGHGARVVRNVLADLHLITGQMAGPGVHIFAWRGMKAPAAERILSGVLASTDVVRTWQRGDFAFGVIVRRMVV